MKNAALAIKAGAAIFWRDLKGRVYMYYIGIDVGGTGFAAGLVDENYQIIYRKSVPTDRSVNAEQMVEMLAALADDVMSGAGVRKEEIKSIGLGVPGTANLKTGQIEYANNLPFCQGDLRKGLKEKTGIEVYFDNDANAAAWGEYLMCENKPDSFVMVTLGTGIGCGIVLNGKLFRGVNYAAGEIGHMTVKLNGRPCPCGRRGCLELYASAQALVEQAKKKMRKKEESILWKLCDNNIEEMDGRKFFEAVRLVDACAVKVLKWFTKYLGEGMIDLINTLQPEVFCIGGGISKAADLFLPQVEKRVAEKVYSKDSAQNTQLVAAKLGIDAGIIGAAMLHLCDEESKKTIVRNKIQFFHNFK